MKLSDACLDYLKHVKYARGLSARTVEGYQSWLRFFLNWCEENGHPQPTLKDFTTATLRHYLYFLAETKDYRPRSVRGVFCPIIGLGEFLLTHKAIKKNPARGLALPKKDAAIRNVVTNDEIQALLAACERIHPPRRAAMCRAVVSVLAYTGIRRGELLDLRIPDVNLKERWLIVRSGKGLKSRIVYFPAETVPALREWLNARGEARENWLFAYDPNRRLGESGLKMLVREVKTAAGLREKAHIQPHSIRHNYATRMLRNGADLGAIQAALGHTKLETTAVYLHTNEESQRKIAHLASFTPDDSPPIEPIEPKQRAQQETENDPVPSLRYNREDLRPVKLSRPIRRRKS